MWLLEMRSSAVVAHACVLQPQIKYANTMAMSSTGLLLSNMSRIRRPSLQRLPKQVDAVA